jgi:hypothetical protein
LALATGDNLTVADLLETWSDAQLQQFMLNAPSPICEKSPNCWGGAELRSLLQSSCADDFQQAVSHWLPFSPSQPIRKEMAKTAAEDGPPMAVQRDNIKGASQQQQQKRDRKWPDLNAFAKQSRKKQSSSGMVILESSVVDPGPQEPHVFEPPGSGFIRQRYGSESGSRSFPLLIKMLSGLK